MRDRSLIVLAGLVLAVLTPVLASEPSGKAPTPWEAAWRFDTSG